MIMGILVKIAFSLFHLFFFLICVKLSTKSLIVEEGE